ncbi:hypothetical protein HanHA300_Chr13g0465721 [Helianthus annuus]|nr:hypothetical protein HanHA300_Chr13g0465721 [Helianthus annuus]KAJ0662342.1 hypothetical protein HanLR1_Chr13g0468341 [Helianthus annuus]
MGLMRLRRNSWGSKVGGLRHHKYTSKYIEMARLVMYLIITEKRRMVYYVTGYSPKVRALMKASGRKTFEIVMEIGGILYDDEPTRDPGRSGLTLLKSS